MAKKPRRIASPQAVSDVLKIIEQHHAALAALLFGRAAVTDAEWETATKLGFVEDGAPGVFEDLPTFGAWVGDAPDPASAEGRYGALTVGTGPHTSTPTAGHAGAFALEHGAVACRGLGNKVGAEIGSKLIEADKALAKEMSDKIKDAVASHFGNEAAVSRQEARALEAGLPADFYDGAVQGTVKRIASDIGHATDDWARDLQRIAHTEGHTAVSEGLVEHWQEAVPEDEAGNPPEILVFKLTRPGACKHCLWLHEDGGAPRIYDLDEAQGNGTNVGKKAADWLFVVGSVHSWCACTLCRVPSFVTMPPGWKSGDAAPSVIGPGGRIV